MRLTSFAAVVALSLFGCTQQDGTQPTATDDTNAVVSEISSPTQGYCSNSIDTDWDEYVPGVSPRFLWPENIQHITIVYTTFSDGFYVWAIGNSPAVEGRVLNVFHVKTTDNGSFMAAMGNFYGTVAAIPGSSRMWSIAGTSVTGGGHPNPPVGPGGFPWQFRNRVLHFAQHQYDTAVQTNTMLTTWANAYIPQGTTTGINTTGAVLVPQ